MKYKIYNKRVNSADKKGMYNIKTFSAKRKKCFKQSFYR